MRRGLALLAVSALVLSGCSDAEDGDAGPPTVTATPSDTESAPAPSSGEPSPSETGREGPPQVEEVLVTGLAVPWGIDFLPDGVAVVTERDSGRVLTIDEGGDVTEVGVIEEATPESESGLPGVAVSPDFDEDQLIYLYVTTQEDNRIIRATLEGDTLGEPEVILDGIPRGPIHDGGRLEFGPAGILYASTGETGIGELAQDMSSLGGKILRITADGDPAPDNPDPDSPLFSWGHRNVQGLAFDDDDNLWASEFGDNTYDELNLIEKGGNYGWPEVEGRGDSNGGEFTNPQVVWETFEASPSGLAHLDGQLWLAALRGARLWRIDIESGRASSPTDFFVGDYGRLRTVVVAPDGNLWVTTSNRDGRAEPGPDDDQILVVSPG